MNPDGLRCWWKGRLVAGRRATRAVGAGRAFSLVEVVVAVGLLTMVLVGMLGALAAAGRWPADSADAATAVHLAEAVRSELEEIRAGAGLDGLAAIIPSADTAAGLRLVATRDGRTVRRVDGPAAPAERPLDDPSHPGIARRDRFFLIEVKQLVEPLSTPAAGFLAVTVQISWPYCLPAGPGTPGETRPSADPAREVPAEERQTECFNLALRP